MTCEVPLVVEEAAGMTELRHLEEGPASCAKEPLLEEGRKEGTIHPIPTPKAEVEVAVACMRKPLQVKKGATSFTKEPLVKRGLLNQSARLSRLRWRNGAT